MPHIQHRLSDAAVQGEKHESKESKDEKTKAAKERGEATGEGDTFQPGQWTPGKR